MCPLGKLDDLESPDALGMPEDLGKSDDLEEPDALDMPQDPGKPDAADQPDAWRRRLGGSGSHLSTLPVGTLRPTGAGRVPADVRRGK